LPVGSGRVEKARPAGQTRFEGLENLKINHIYFIDYFNHILILYSAFVKIMAWHKICYTENYILNQFHHWYVCMYVCMYVFMYVSTEV